MSYLKILVATCQANNIDGVIVDESENEHVSFIRQSSDLIVVSSAKKIMTPEEVVTRITAGAHLV